MKMEKISGGFARVGQFVLLAFFIPFISFLSYVIIRKNFGFDGISVLTAFIVLILFITWKAFSYGDIFISNNSLVIKKCFSNKHIPMKEVKEIDRAMLPNTYYLKLEDASKVFFFSKTSEIFKQLIKSGPNNYLRSLRERILMDNVP